jgi:hypothetical protein
MENEIRVKITDTKQDTSGKALTEAFIKRYCNLEHTVRISSTDMKEKDLDEVRI